MLKPLSKLSLSAFENLILIAQSAKPTFKADYSFRNEPCIKDFGDLEL